MNRCRNLQWLPYDAAAFLAGFGFLASVIWGVAIHSGLVELAGKLWR